MILQDNERQSLPFHEFVGVEVDVPIQLIDAHPQQPRRRFDPQELDTLAKSLQADSLLQRPLVRAMPNGRYQLVAGERRFRAAKLAGWKALPVVVRELSDFEALRLLGVENQLRADWGPLELARYLDALCKPRERGGAGLSLSEAGSIFGKSATWASRHRGMLSLPSVWHERVARNELRPDNLAVLLPLIDQPEALAAIDRDYRAHPKRWLSTESFKRNVDAIVGVPSAHRHARPAEKPPSPARLNRSVERTATALETRGPVEPPLPVPKPGPLINTNQVCRLLRPFLSDRASLIMIRDTCDRLIRELPAAAEVP